MGHSVIPEPNSPQRCCRKKAKDCRAADDEAFMEAKPIVLTGQAAVDFAEMVLSPAPEMAPALRRAAERHRKMVISE